MRGYLVVGSVILWIISGVHFFTVCSLLVLLGAFVDPRKTTAAALVLPYSQACRVSGAMGPASINSDQLLCLQSRQSV
jgi:hypothetical protein